LVLGLWVTSQGLLATNDTAAYYSGSENLARGGGFSSPTSPETTPFDPYEQVAFGQHVPLTDWPPLYAVVLALPQAVGDVDAATVARAVNAISFSLLITVVGYATYRATGRSWVMALLAALVIGIGPASPDYLGPGGPLSATTVALADAMFLPVCLASLILSGLALSTGRRTALVAACVLIVAATLTRYIGIAAGVAGAMATITWTVWSWRQRARWAALLIAPGVFAILAWSAYLRWSSGAGAKPIAWHPSAQISSLLDIIAPWFSLPGAWPDPVRRTLTILVVATLVVVGLVPRVRDGALRLSQVAQSLRATVAVLAAFIVAYVAGLIITHSLIDATAPMNQRLLTPIQVAVYMLALLELYGVVRSRAASSDRRAVAACGGLAVLVLGFSFGHVARLRDIPNNVRTARESLDAQAQPLRSVPPEWLLFSNNPSSVWVLQDRSAYMVPLRTSKLTTMPNRQFESDIRAIERILKTREGLVALTPGLPTLEASPEDYARLTNLQRFGECPDGTALLALPESRAAQLAADLC
jgi:hypothetical protein